MKRAKIAKMSSNEHVKAMTDQINRMMAMELAAEAQTRNRAGERILHRDLGPLTHDGHDFVGKHKTALYPRAAIEIRLEPELSESPAVRDVWNAFCKRAHKLRCELETEIAMHYEEFRRRAALLKPEPLKRASDIWKTLGRPTILIQRKSARAEICIAWSPQWESEHGLRVYITQRAAIQEIE